MTVPAQHWDDIPEELRWTNQWLIAGPNELGLMKVPKTFKNGSLFNANNTDPSLFMDFETACEVAESLGYGIGFVLCATDPYCCIDLDVKNQHNHPNEPDLWTPQEYLDRFWNIAQAFGSYTERSRSGQGLHVWVRANIGKGCNHDGVEVYSQERFIVCTGNHIMNLPIVAQQERADSLVAEIRLRQGKGKNKVELVEVEEEWSDEEIFERAINAANADKFNALCQCTSNNDESGAHGTWKDLGYKSQSEADLALMSIFTFYSDSNAQCKRLFRMTGLGKREKAMKNDRHLDNALVMIRGRQANQQLLDEHARAAGASLVIELQAKKLAEQAFEQAQQAQQAMPQAAGAVPVLAPNGALPVEQKGLQWPPGFAGALAYYIYQSSPRPVKEVSIIATLGLLAGFCGKTYQIPQSGLNIYMILVARSAVGKEAMHSGIGSVMSQLRGRVPGSANYVDFADFASGQALQKACAANQSFVNVSGEWGRKLKRIADENGRDASMQSLRTVMTNLYQKSGPTSIVGGITYSNKEQNIASVSGVAYSMIGETTPNTFYESLTEAMMEDGFMSRFTVIEYNGERPPLNPNPMREMESSMLEWMVELSSHSLRLAGMFQKCDVQYEASAKVMLDDFDKECDREINKTTDESWRQMWNRAHLKVLRIAALLAVADNFHAPLVWSHHVVWALDLIRRDIKMFQRRVLAGDIGSGDTVRENKLLSTIREYMESVPNSSYGIPVAIHKAGIVPRKYLQTRCGRITSFATHRNGSVSAIDLAMRSLVDNGYVVEMDKMKLATEYAFHGKAYRVIHLPLSVTA